MKIQPSRPIKNAHHCHDYTYFVKEICRISSKVNTILQSCPDYYHSRGEHASLFAWIEEARNLPADRQHLVWGFISGFCVLLCAVTVACWSGRAYEGGWEWMSSSVTPLCVYRLLGESGWIGGYAHSKTSPITQPIKLMYFRHWPFIAVFRGTLAVSAEILSLLWKVRYFNLKDKNIRDHSENICFIFLFSFFFFTPNVKY